MFKKTKINKRIIELKRKKEWYEAEIIANYEEIDYKFKDNKFLKYTFENLNEHIKEAKEHVASIMKVFYDKWRIDNPGEITTIKANEKYFFTRREERRFTKSFYSNNGYAAAGGLGLTSEKYKISKKEFDEIERNLELLIKYREDFGIYNDIIHCLVTESFYQKTWRDLDDAIEIINKKYIKPYKMENETIEYILKFMIGIIKEEDKLKEINKELKELNSGI